MADSVMSTHSAAHYGTRYGGRRPGNLAGFTVAVAVHLAAVLYLLQYEPARRALTDAVPIMVSLITPVVEIPQDPPKPLAIKPRVVEPKPVERAPVLTAPAETPAPYVAAAPPAPAQEPATAPAPVALPVVPPDFSAAYLRNPPPAYPYLARRMGQQGKVMLRVLVSAVGLPEKVELRTGSGTRALDEAALEAVGNWRFVAARQGNQPVSAWVLVPIVFSLQP